MPTNQLAAQAVIDAVIATLKADAVLAALLSSDPTAAPVSPPMPAVYDTQAPQGVPYEYLVVSDGGEVSANALGRGFGAAVLVYLRATSRSARTAKAITSCAVKVLDAPETALAVDGYASSIGELVSAGPGYGEEVRGEVIQHHPAVVRITVSGLIEGSPA